MPSSVSNPVPWGFKIVLLFVGEKGREGEREKKNVMAREQAGNGRCMGARGKHWQSVEDSEL